MTLAKQGIFNYIFENLTKFHLGLYPNKTDEKMLKNRFYYLTRKTKSKALTFDDVNEIAKGK
jgi:hypothetical protein